MSTFDEVKQYGDGALDFRLEVEGWPAEWVTNTRITHADGADGRAVLGGLHYDGIEISERIVMAESLLQVKPIAFKITPPYKYVDGSTQWTDEDTYWLAREADPVETINVALAYDATTISFTSGSAWGNGTVFFLGTETIRVTNWPTIDRGIWNSQAQAHPLESFGRSFDVYTYNEIPPTMEGRRVWLYVYGEGDSGAGNGTCIWRGMVVRVPFLAGGAMPNTWVIDCQNISHVLSQNVAGAIETANVVGIYHHNQCPFTLTAHFDGVEYGPAWYVGIDINEANFISSVNDWIDAVFTAWDPVGLANYFSFFGIVKTTDGLQLMAVRSTDPNVVFITQLGSPLVGFALAGSNGRDWKAFATAIGIPSLDPSETGYVPLTMDPEVIAYDTGYAYQGAPVMVLGDARPMLHFSVQRAFTPSTDLLRPPLRIHIDTDFTGVNAVYISGTRKPGGIFNVLASGVESGIYWIEVEDWRSTAQVVTASGLTVVDPLTVAGCLGYLNGETEIYAIRNYDAGRVDDFIRALKVAARDFGNTGDTPFVTASDMTDLEPVSVHGLARWRVYSFLRRRKLIDIITSELRFINHFLRLDIQGKIDSAALPRWTEATAVDELYEIDGSSILTQSDGSGSAPTYTPNRDGRITMVQIQHRYLPRDDEWDDKPAVFFDPKATSIAKTRGKAPDEIKLYSTPAAPAGSGELEELEKQVARPRLAFFSRTYGVVKVEVPFTKFDVLCGDIVSLTHEDIPDGEGARGVDGRRGVVIERAWNMDGAKARRGEFTILLTPRGVVGYAPSAILVAAENVSGNTWLLSFAMNTATYEGRINVEMAQEGGSLASHFAAGDFVRVYSFNEIIPTARLGVVQSASPANDQVTVTFSSAWSPGVGESFGDWVLEYQTDLDDAHSTSSQRRYCFSADDQALMANGGYARRFA